METGGNGQVAQLASQLFRIRGVLVGVKTSGLESGQSCNVAKVSRQKKAVRTHSVGHPGRESGESSPTTKPATSHEIQLSGSQS